MKNIFKIMVLSLTVLSLTVLTGCPRINGENNELSATGPKTGYYVMTGVNDDESFMKSVEFYNKFEVLTEDEAKVLLSPFAIGYLEVLSATEGKICYINSSLSGLDEKTKEYKDFVEVAKFTYAVDGDKIIVTCNDVSAYDQDGSVLAYSKDSYTIDASASNDFNTISYDYEGETVTANWNTNKPNVDSYMKAFIKFKSLMN